MSLDITTGNCDPEKKRGGKSDTCKTLKDFFGINQNTDLLMIRALKCLT